MAEPTLKRRIHKAPMKTLQEQFVSEIACLPGTLLDPFSHPQGLLHVWRAPSWEEIAGGGDGETGEQAAMNTNSEAKKTCDQSQSAGARRSRRLTARTVLGVPESLAWWTLKRPEAHAPKELPAPFPASHRTPRRWRVAEARLECPRGFGVRWVRGERKLTPN